MLFPSADQWLLALAYSVNCVDLPTDRCGFTLSTAASKIATVTARSVCGIRYFVGPKIKTF